VASCSGRRSLLQCVAVCCSALQCVAVCRSVEQGFRVQGLCLVFLVQGLGVCCSALQCGAVRCIVQ